MKSLADQIEELEDDYQAASRKITELEQDLADTLVDLRDRESDLDWYREFEEWVEATYPGTRRAYEGKLRLDKASVG